MSSIIFIFIDIDQGKKKEERGYQNGPISAYNQVLFFV